MTHRYRSGVVVLTAFLALALAPLVQGAAALSAPPLLFSADAAPAGLDRDFLTKDSDLATTVPALAHEMDPALPGAPLHLACWTGHQGKIKRPC